MVLKEGTALKGTPALVSTAVLVVKASMPTSSGRRSQLGKKKKKKKKKKMKLHLKIHVEFKRESDSNSE